MHAEKNAHQSKRKEVKGRLDPVAQSRRIRSSRWQAPKTEN